MPKRYAEKAVDSFHRTVLRALIYQVLNVVLAASEVANKIKEEATVVKDKAENLVALISVDQKEAEGKLLAAKPALDAAEQALLVSASLLHIQCIYFYFTVFSLRIVCGIKVVISLKILNKL